MRAPFTQLYVHLVWSTWDRAPVITAEIKTRLYAAMLGTCKELKCSPIAIGGIDDHVHLLIQLHPSVAVADLVKNVKGSSSHLINHAIKPGGNFRWQGSYGAFSIRKHEVEQVTHYILNQEQHHAQQSLDEEFERTDIPA
jgi:putative transposase